MRFGFHLSIAGGCVKAARAAALLGTDCLQIFSGNPRGWKQKPITEPEAGEFRSEVSRAGLNPVVVHAPYLLNLASPDPQLWRRSWLGLAEQFKRAACLGAKAVVAHPGSRGEKSLKWGVRRVAEAVCRAYESSGGQVPCWLENTCGGGSLLGGDLSELAAMLKLIPQGGACLDTAHAWGQGYALDNQVNVAGFLDLVEDVLDFKQVKLWHFNDSKVELGSKRDVHTHLGQGFIGEKGFKALVSDSRLHQASAIMETPKENSLSDKQNLAFIRRLEALAACTPQ